MAELYLEISRYYNSECVYRKDVEVIVQNYDKIAGSFIKRVNIGNERLIFWTKTLSLLRRYTETMMLFLFSLKNFKAKERITIIIPRRSRNWSVKSRYLKTQEKETILGKTWRSSFE